MKLHKAITIAMLVSAFYGLAQAQEGASAARKPSHCVIQTEAVRQGEIVPVYSPNSKPQCFDSFSEALNAATNGGVKASQDLLPENLTAEMLAKSNLQPQATFVIGVEFVHAGFGGSSLTYSSSVTCDGFVLSASYVGNDWNDHISSAKAYSNCNHSQHFEHANFVGASVDCFSECSYIGDALNDRTSSIKWFQ